MDPQLFLEVVSHVEVLLVHSPHEYILPEPFRLALLKALARSTSSGTQQGTGGPFCSPIGSIELSKGPAMASGGPE